MKRRSAGSTRDASPGAASVENDPEGTVLAVFDDEHNRVAKVGIEEASAGDQQLSLKALHGLNHARSEVTGRRSHCGLTGSSWRRTCAAEDQHGLGTCTSRNVRFYPAPVNEKRWRIGELASAAGVTVRTLHHYDEIGLLTPSQRSEAGHRLYVEADVRRLYQVLALRQLELPLAEVAAALDGHGGDLRATLRRHIERVERQLSLQRGLREHLLGIAAALDGADEPSAQRLLEVMEVMSKMDRYYTQEQLDQLEQRRNELGREGMEKAHRDWAEVIGEVEAEYARGTPPDDPRMQRLAARWTDLIEQFTGGDPGIRASLQRMYDEEGPEVASRGAVRPELMDYVRRAQEAYER
jgi:DNA-binding transcriptional MerR regulator